MQIIADLHTHTLSATHAFNTLDEMAAKAAALGYAALAITDHGPAMPDAPHMWHFANQTALPLVLHGVAMMYGAEANVMDTNGGLDFAQSRLRALDWVVASIHSPCNPGLLTEKEATRLWLAVAENPYVDCIGHSEQLHVGDTIPPHIDGIAVELHNLMVFGERFGYKVIVIAVFC